MTADGARAALAGAAVFVASACVQDAGLLEGQRFRDLGLYRRYGDAAVGGEVPYRDFFLEYPPGALAAFVPPALAPSGAYPYLFKAFMALCAVAAIVAALVIVERCGARRGRLYAVAVPIGLAPLALGQVSLNTYDNLPAALTVGSLAALVADRPRLALGLLGAGFATKLYPLALAPLAVAVVARRDGGRRAGEAVAAFLGVAAAAIAPFALLAPHEVWSSFRAQLGRALHVESLGGSLLLAADRLGLYEATVVRGTGVASRDLAGDLPDALATAGGVLAAAGAAGVLALYLRGRASAERTAVAFAATVASVLALGKVLSPQYLEWLVPLVPLAGAAAGALLALCLVLGQVWFSRYPELFAIEGVAWLVVTRNAVLVALAVLLVARVRRRA